jgi:death-on-curing protein
MNEPAWIEKKALLLLHAKSLAWFGGAEGLRDEGLLDSALARPRNVFYHDGQHDIAALAAAYAFGLVRNHPFIDGNKRAAFLAVGIFLGSNGCALDSEPAEAIRAMLALAGSEIGEAEFATWIRLHSRRG